MITYTTIGTADIEKAKALYIKYRVQDLKDKALVTKEIIDSAKRQRKAPASNRGRKYPLDQDKNALSTAKAFSSFDTFL